MQYIFLCGDPKMYPLSQLCVLSQRLSERALTSCSAVRTVAAVAVSHLQPLMYKKCNSLTIYVLRRAC